MAKRYTDEEITEAVKLHGGKDKAARALNMDSRGLRRRIKRINHGIYTDSPIETPQMLSGVSTLRKFEDDQGTIVLQWEKTSKDTQQMSAMLSAATAALFEKIPRATATPAPPQQTDKLLNVYTITDYHFGLLSWAPETGDDWDTNIAESMLLAWFERTISLAPAADSCVFAQIGDFLHFDGLEALTPSSGHPLDADTRFCRLVRVAIRTVDRVINMLRAKYRTVHVLMAEGNHDLASSVWLRELFAAKYEMEPRVTVETRPDPYYCYEHGLTSIFWHHGHKHRIGGLDTVFAAKFRDVFGRTKHSYAHTGHLHHRDLKETNLMIVEQHRTLAGADAYAARGGWMSGRSSTVITYHKEYGEVGRITVSPEML